MKPTTPKPPRIPWTKILKEVCAVQPPPSYYLCDLSPTFFKCWHKETDKAHIITLAQEYNQLDPTFDWADCCKNILSYGTFDSKVAFLKWARLKEPRRAPKSYSSNT